MSISSTTRIAGPFTGAGTQATFPFSFKVFDTADLFVVTLNVSTGAIAVLALETDYTATLNPDQDSSPGGSITLVAGNLATGLTLTITTDMEQLQALDLTNGGGFYPDVINAALDTFVILLQQLFLIANRALTIPLPDQGTSMELPAAAERAGKVLMFDGAGNPTLVTMASGSIIPGAQVATGTVDGSNTNFNFTSPGAATPAPLVFAGGVYQVPGISNDYTISLVSVGIWKITFNVAPANAPIAVVNLA